MSAEQRPAPTQSGPARFLRDFIKRRQRYRQFTGVAFLVLLTIVGQPANPALYTLGVVLAVLGIAVRLWASGHVKKNKQLATSGPYAYVRHPLYVGNHLITAGFCFASGLWWSFIGWALIGFYFYPHTIRHEDRNLARYFPGDWETWAKETRALIPRLTPYRPGERSEWSFSQSLRKNGEPIIAALLLIFLYILYTRLP